MEILLLIITLVVMGIGFVGVFIPALPGNGLIFAAALFYAFITKFSDITVITIIILGIFTILSFILDFGAGLITTKKVGASKYGLVGAFIGGIIGLIVFNIIGLIIGQLMGAIIGELIIKTEFKKSVKIGVATFIGYLLGIVGNSTIAVIMIVIFVLKIIL